MAIERDPVADSVSRSRASVAIPTAHCHFAPSPLSLYRRFRAPFPMAIADAPPPVSSTSTPTPSSMRLRSARRGSFFQLHALDAAYAREMLLPMSLGLIVLVVVLTGNLVYWTINAIVNQGISVAPIIKLFFLALPGFAVLGIPVGVILAVCLVLNRAVRDNEILALRVGGASLPRIVMPFLFMALLASFFDYYVIEKVAPVTNERANKLTAMVMSQNTAPLIQTDRYFRAGPYYFYVGSAENGILHQVMVYQRAQTRYSEFVPTTFPTVQIAQSAFENPKRKGEWILENGYTHVYNADGTQLSEAIFDRISIKVDQELTAYFGEDKGAETMTGAQILAKIEALQNGVSNSNELQTLRVDYYRHFSLPGACFVMALCAAPLSLRYARHGSFAGLVAAFLLAFLWQGFDGWFRALGIAGYFSPIVAAWATDALFLWVGIALMVRER